MRYFTLLPAYGRDYKTRKEMVDDWLNGKDFRLSTTGQYVSIRDANLLAPATIMGRYRKETMLCEIAKVKVT